MLRNPIRTFYWLSSLAPIDKIYIIIYNCIVTILHHLILNQMNIFRKYEEDKMYTLVFKFKDEEMVVFDLCHTKRGKQLVIGNIFCQKEDNRYKAHSLISLSSVPEQQISKKSLDQIYYNAEYICNQKWFK